MTSRNKLCDFQTQELLTKIVNKCIMWTNIWIKGDKMSTIVLYKDRLNGINTYINDAVN